MNLTSNDYPVLVAPRPRRILSGPPYTLPTRSHPVRLVSASGDRFKESGLDDLKVGVITETPPGSDKELPSPRASPRSNLPSEALEEFLSILRPSFFLPPTSPILRTRHHASAHPYSFKGQTLEIIQQRSEPHIWHSVDNLDQEYPHPQSQDSSRSTPSSVNDDDGAAAVGLDISTRWYNSKTLSSPVSRTQTRNPWQRHPSYETPFSEFASSYPAAPSPTGIPLPPPTPSEIFNSPCK